MWRQAQRHETAGGGTAGPKKTRPDFRPISELRVRLIRRPGRRATCHRAAQREKGRKSDLRLLPFSVTAIRLGSEGGPTSSRCWRWSASPACAAAKPWSRRSAPTAGQAPGPQPRRDARRPRHGPQPRRRGLIAAFVREHFGGAAEKSGRWPGYARNAHISQRAESGHNQGTTSGSGISQRRIH